MTTTALILIALVAIFEFINGFHDTANAVATVIYTKTLRPQLAVIYSGLMNFLGVLLGWLGVAFSIVALIPIVDIVPYGETNALLVIIAILTTSILWNILTRYRGLPASSSHTLIGSVFGAFVGFILLHHESWSLLPSGHLITVIIGLIISPLIGFALTYGLVSLVRHFPITEHWFLSIHHKHEKHNKPPLHVRALLVVTCGLVSFFHGSNDGQKGVGLVVLILTLLMPATYSYILESQTVPLRVMILIPVCLGLGTTIWWKRIVKTLGKKIGKHHLTYLQGASSEIVAAATIGLSSALHLPISTTHVLSSGIAGSMVAEGGLKNIRIETIKNIAYAWILTLPFCIIVSGLIVYGIWMFIS